MLFRTTVFCLILLVCAGCLRIRMEENQPAGPHAWTTDGQSPDRTRSLSILLDPPLEKAWDFDAGAGFGPKAAIMLDEVILVNTRKGFVQAIDRATGDRIGKEKFSAPIEGNPVYQDDTIYLPLGLHGVSVTAYDLVRGKELWRADGDPVESGLLLEDTTLYFADSRGIAHAIGAHSGVPIWESALDTTATFLASPVLIDQMLIMISEKGDLYQLNKKSGSVDLTTSLDLPVEQSFGHYNGKLFVPTTRGALLSVDVRTREVTWSFVLADHHVRFTSPAISAQANALFFGGTDGWVRALDLQRGQLIWQHKLDGAISSAPVATQNTVYAGSMRGVLVDLDIDSGARTWEEKMRGRLKTALVAGDSALVVLTDNQRVTLMRPMDILAESE